MLVSNEEDLKWLKFPNFNSLVLKTSVFTFFSEVLIDKSCGWMGMCLLGCCVCRPTNKQTHTGWDCSERAQSPCGCLFSAWQRLLLLPQVVFILVLVCPVASSALSQSHCPAPTPSWMATGSLALLGWPCPDPAVPQQGQSGHVLLFWKRLSRVTEGPCAIPTAQVVQVPYQVCLVWPGIRVRTFWHQHVLQIICPDETIRSLFQVLKAWPVLSVVIPSYCIRIDVHLQEKGRELLVGWQKCTHWVFQVLCSNVPCGS